MSLFCASHIRESERKTHTQREKEREKSVETVSIALSQEGRNEREKTNLDWKKPPRSSPKGTREISERKTKAKKKKRRYKTHSVFK
jgi:hypothetical protein